MSDFDPYFKWLGIPLEDQPPNHYRLLGIPVFTNDADAIENAADQRMSYVRKFATGKRGLLTQKLLNELSQARVCLLDEKARSAYDQSLQDDLAANQPDPTPSPEPVTDVTELDFSTPPIQVSVPKAKRSRSRRTKRNVVIEIIKVAVGGVAGLAIAYLIVAWFAPLADIFGVFKGRETASVSQEPGGTEERRGLNTSPPRPEPSSSEKRTKVPNSTTKDPAVSSPTPSPSDPTPPEPTPPDTTATNKAPPNSARDTAARRAELQSTRDAAIKDGNIGAALQAVEAIALLEGTDALEAKFAVVGQMKSTLASRLLAEHLLRLTQQAIKDDRKELAAQYADDLILAARESDDPDLIRSATLAVLGIASTNDESQPEVTR
jgi:cytoskeletal protein RodZ